MEDHELLHEYAERRTEAAFAELVSRHINLVYSTALRMVGDPQFAQDIAQTVFIELARNPKSIRDPRALAGWLYRTTRFAVGSALRTEQRRRQRENVAMEMNAADSNPETAWQSLAPHIEEAMATLDADDQSAVVLRFFENKSLREVGAALGLSDDAAQKRVSRALEKLRSQFARHGITTTASALSVTIAANAVQVAPAGLAAMLTSASLAAGAGTTMAAFKLITMTTLQKTIIGATLVAAIGTGIFQTRQASQLREQNHVLQQQIVQLRSDNESLSRRSTRSRNQPALRLPAPSIPASAPSAAPEVTMPNVLAHMVEKPLHLTAEQAEKFLDDNHRSASSLLAAFRTTTNMVYLDEAMQKFPNDPQVAFEVVLRKEAPPGEKRRWLDALKKSAPDNPLANYLSALEYFNTGKSDQAVQELTAASGKSRFNDYYLDSLQADEEAYRAAGYSEIETRVGAAMGSPLSPHLASLKDLTFKMVELANSYRQTGDETSARTALEMTVSMGEHFDGSKDGAGLPPVYRAFGFAIEAHALQALNPGSPFGSDGGTVQDRLDYIHREKAAIVDLVQQLDTLAPKATPQDMINFLDRARLFGDKPALEWLKQKYGEQ